MSEDTSHPTRAGQAVRNLRGQIGITTDEPRKRTPSIPVMFLKTHYPVMEQISDLTVIAITESDSPD